MLRVTLLTLLGLASTILSGHSQPNQDANRIFSESILHGIVNLTRLPNVGLQRCGASAQYVMAFSTPTFTEELVHASRGGSKEISVDGFTGERVEVRNEKLDYWLTKIRLAGGSVKVKDVTTNQSVVTDVIDWVVREYAKDLVQFVGSHISSAAQAVYGVAADEYISAGIKRYDAVIEYWRSNTDAAGTGVIQRISLTCAR